MNPSLRRLLFIPLLILSVGFTIHAQEEPVGANLGSGEAIPGLRRRTVVMDIDARVLEEKKVVIWSETTQKIVIPGNPVGIKLVGSNIVVSVQFTPYIRRSGSVLVAQGQIWINDPDKGMSYFTSLQTIPMEFGEPIYFFPLGSSTEPKTPTQLDASIEIIVTVNRNPAGNSGAETAVKKENDN
jgi:hypothetical protein